MKEHIKFVHDGKIHKCHLCDSFFSRKNRLNKHAKTVHEGKVLICSHCNQFFSCKDNLQKHVKRVHEGNKLKCSICDKKFWEFGSKSALLFKRHMEKHQSGKNDTDSVHED